MFVSSSLMSSPVRLDNCRNTHLKQQYLRAQHCTYKSRIIQQYSRLVTRKWFNERLRNIFDWCIKKIYFTKRKKGNKLDLLLRIDVKKIMIMSTKCNFSYDISNEAQIYLQRSFSLFIWDSYFCFSIGLEYYLKYWNIIWLYVFFTMDLERLFEVNTSLVIQK